MMITIITIITTVVIRALTLASVVVLVLVLVVLMRKVMMKLTLDSVGIKVVTSSASNRLSWPKRLAAIWFTPL